MSRLGFAYSKQPETKAAGEQLKTFAPFLVLGDGSIAWTLAEAIRKCEGKAVGDQWYDDYVERFGIPRNGWMESVARKRDAAEGRGDFSEALAMQSRILFVPPQGSENPYYLNYMPTVAAYYRLLALDAWARKDWAVVADGLSRVMDNGPPDVELMEKVVPALKSADKAAAERVLGRARERLKAVVEDYPDAEKYVKALARVEALQSR